jgi:hypothetical protein
MEESKDVIFDLESCESLKSFRFISFCCSCLPFVAVLFHPIKVDRMIRFENEFIVNFIIVSIVEVQLRIY